MSSERFTISLYIRVRVAVAEWLARRLLLLFTGSITGGATWLTRNNLE